MFTFIYTVYDFNYYIKRDAVNTMVQGTLAATSDQKFYLNRYSHFLQINKYQIQSFC